MVFCPLLAPSKNLRRWRSPAGFSCQGRQPGRPVGTSGTAL